MKKWLIGLSRNESGVVLPIVLVLMVVGTLIALPSLNFVSTGLKAGETIEENVRGVYAADAGIEDAIWRLNNESLQNDVPITYTLKDASGNDAIINGMTVTVNMDLVPFIDEDKVLKVGTHQDWLTIDKSCTESPPGSGHWIYQLNIIDWASPKNYNVLWLAIDLPAGLQYDPGTCTGSITTNDPSSITGTVQSGIRLTWNGTGPGGKLFTIEDTEGHDPTTYTLNFTLTEVPPYLTDPDPDGVIAMYVQDELKFVTDAWPYIITATASNSKGEQAKIRVGVWISEGIFIRDWELSP